jgi:phosphopantetheine adenylyltransferase
MKGYRQLISEIKSRKVVFAFGRFQPPTIGHELLVKAVQRIATEQGADHVIFASKSEDKKSNPLNVKDKVYFLKRMFPTANFMAAGDNTRTFIEVAKELNKKYKSIVMVGGSDRVAEFKRILTTYNGKEFNYDSIEVKSAGERDPDSDSAAGMSGTKMRMAAKDGDFTKFKTGLPSTLTAVDARRLFNKLRSGMGLEAIKEEVEFERDSIREAYHAGKILHIGEQVTDKKDNRFEIVDRGSNYVTVVDGSGQLHRKWIFDVVAESKKQNVVVESEGIFYKGYETQNLHKEVEGDFFRKLAESDKDPVAILNSIKLADELFEEYCEAKYDKLESYLSNIDMLEEWKTYNRENLQEMKFNTTDRIRVGRIIGLSLGVEDVDKKSNPEQIINLGLRKLRGKRITPEMRDLLNRMLNTAKMANINYDEKLVPQQAKQEVKEETQSFLTYYQFRQELAKTAKEMGQPEDVQPAKTNAGHSMDSNPRMAHRKAHQRMHENLELSEAANKEDPIYKEYVGLKKLDIKQLRNLIKQQRRVVDTSEYRSKDHAASDILRSKHGNKKFAAAMGLSEETLDEANVDSAEKAAEVADLRARQAREKHDLVKKHQRERDELKEEDEKEDVEIDDSDFDDDINSITEAEHIIHLYDEDEFAFVDEEGNEVSDDNDDEQLDEALSRMERIKRGIRFARTKSKRERRRSIALKRRSTQPVINRRARKHAILMLKKRLARKPLDKLSVQEKERIERMVQQRKKLIDRLAVRMAPKIRKIETQRLSHQKFTKEDFDLEESKTLKDIAAAAEKRAGSIIKPKVKPAPSSTKKSLSDISKAAEKRKMAEEIEEYISDEEFEQILQMEGVTVEYATQEEAAQFDALLEAEYQGRSVTLNKPMAGDVKKSKVFVKDPSTGNVIKVNFGDKNMTIKKSNPERRKSFRARHKCDAANDKTTPRYWSCKAW